MRFFSATLTSVCFRSKFIAVELVCMRTMMFHLSLLTVCLPACLTFWVLILCPSILFWFSAYAEAGSRDFNIVYAVESYRLRYDYYIECAYMCAFMEVNYYLHYIAVSRSLSQAMKRFAKVDIYIRGIMNTQL